MDLLTRERIFNFLDFACLFILCDLLLLLRSVSFFDSVTLKVPD